MTQRTTSPSTLNQQFAHFRRTFSDSKSQIDIPRIPIPNFLEFFSSWSSSLTKQLYRDFGGNEMSTMDIVLSGFRDDSEQDPEKDFLCINVILYSLFYHTTSSNNQGTKSYDILRDQNKTGSCTELFTRIITHMLMNFTETVSYYETRILSIFSSPPQSPQQSSEKQRTLLFSNLCMLLKALLESYSSRQHSSPPAPSQIPIDIKKLSRFLLSIIFPWDSASCTSTNPTLSLSSPFTGFVSRFRDMVSFPLSIQDPLHSSIALQSTCTLINCCIAIDPDLQSDQPFTTALSPLIPIMPFTIMDTCSEDVHTHLDRTPSHTHTHTPPLRDIPLGLHNSSTYCFLNSVTVHLVMHPQLALTLLAFDPQSEHYKCTLRETQHPTTRTPRDKLGLGFWGRWEFGADTLLPFLPRPADPTERERMQMKYGDYILLPHYTEISYDRAVRAPYNWERLLNLLSELREVFGDLLLYRTHSPNLSHLAPYYYKTNTQPGFVDGQEGDAHEYLSNLLSQLSVYLQVHNIPNFISRFFRIYCCDIVYHNNHIGQRSAPPLWSIEVPRVLQECVDTTHHTHSHTHTHTHTHTPPIDFIRHVHESFRTATLQSSYGLTCETCHELINGETHILSKVFLSLPNTVIFHLESRSPQERLTVEYVPFRVPIVANMDEAQRAFLNPKTHKLFDFAEFTPHFQLLASDTELTPSSYYEVLDEHQRQERYAQNRYMFVGAVMYIPINIHAGHYYSVVFDETRDRWFRFEDQLVTPLHTVEAVQNELMSSERQRRELIHLFFRRVKPLNDWALEEELFTQVQNEMKRQTGVKQHTHTTSSSSSSSSPSSSLSSSFTSSSVTPLFPESIRFFRYFHRLTPELICSHLPQPCIQAPSLSQLNTYKSFNADLQTALQWLSSKHDPDKFIIPFPCTKDVFQSYTQTYLPSMIMNNTLLRYFSHADLDALCKTILSHTHSHTHHSTDVQLDIQPTHTHHPQNESHSAELLQWHLFHIKTHSTDETTLHSTIKDLISMITSTPTLSTTLLSILTQQLFVDEAVDSIQRSLFLQSHISSQQAQPSKQTSGMSRFGRLRTVEKTIQTDLPFHTVTQVKTGMQQEINSIPPSTSVVRHLLFSSNEQIRHSFADLLFRTLQAVGDSITHRDLVLFYQLLFQVLPTLSFLTIPLDAFFTLVTHLCAIPIHLSSIIAAFFPQICCSSAMEHISFINTLPAAHQIRAELDREAPGSAFDIVNQSRLLSKPIYDTHFWDAFVKWRTGTESLYALESPPPSQHDVLLPVVSEVDRFGWSAIASLLPTSAPYCHRTLPLNRLSTLPSTDTHSKYMQQFRSNITSMLSALTACMNKKRDTPLTAFSIRSKHGLLGLSTPSFTIHINTHACTPDRTQVCIAQPILSPPLASPQFDCILDYAFLNGIISTLGHDYVSTLHTSLQTIVQSIVHTELTSLASLSHTHSSPHTHPSDVYKCPSISLTILSTNIMKCILSASNTHTHTLHTLVDLYLSALTLSANTSATAHSFHDLFRILIRVDNIPRISLISDIIHYILTWTPETTNTSTSTKHPHTHTSPSTHPDTPHPALSALLPSDYYTLTNLAKLAHRAKNETFKSRCITLLKAIKQQHSSEPYITNTLVPTCIKYLRNQK